ncbi:alanine racemase [Peptoniphilus sp. KCTC 25270]|uniref:alanine racemase n=1 Tax=Peptoniphilus sp. KCTC 25270 TaxID=2897414 RepID=UPI001E4B2A47|nr:alanine racemase [Peptoniphilus sp. KCTC 25270]MCD1147233.1 alanine racemase [Peptoniphilus sp. KCTC 25270]
MDQMRPIYMEIDLEQYRKNLEIVRSNLADDVDFMMVLKDDAYGAGAVALAKVGIDEGVKKFAVSNMIEALELRDAYPEIEILVLGYIGDVMIPVAIKNSIQLAVWSEEMAKKISEEAKAQGKIEEIHIKLDTGLSRLGFLPTEESMREVERISKMDSLKILGVFSQFGRTETDDDEYSQMQLKTIVDFTDGLKALNVDYGLRHICDSAGIVKFPEAHLDMVRCGALTLGTMTGKDIVPDSENYNTLPITSLKSEVARVVDLPSGTGIGYDGCYTLDHDARIITVPVGYGDGLPTSLSGVMEVLIQGKRAKQVGEICMDMLMFDGTGIDCKQGDEVVLLGKQGEDEISIWDWAEITPSSATFLHSMLRDRIPHRYK